MLGMKHALYLNKNISIWTIKLMVNDYKGNIDLLEGVQDMLQKKQMRSLRMSLQRRKILFDPS